jgi:hypothetical protein
MHIILYLILYLQAPVPDPAAAPVAIRNARVLTAAGPEIPAGTILIRNGKIEAIGADVAVPEGATVIDGKGLVAIPGLVHPYTRIGATASGTGSAPNHLALEELNPSIDGYRPVVRAGFTTLALFPNGGFIAGQAVAFKPRGVSRDQMSLLSPAYLRLDMEASTAAKDQLRQALEGAKRWKERRGGPADAKPDDRTAPVFQVLKGELRAVIEIATPAEYLHWRQILKPFEDPALKIAIVGGFDLWRGAEALGSRKETVLVRPDPSFVPDTRIRISPATELAAAGCTVGFLPPDAFGQLEGYLFRVSQLVKLGFPAEAALKAMTIIPAEAAGVGKRVGSLEKGKDADILLLDGEPFSGTARILKVLIDGKIEHEAAP